MISGAPDQGNGGNRLGKDLKLLRERHIVRGRDVNPVISAMMALLKLTVKRVAAIPDDSGSYNNDARVLISEVNAIIELYDAPNSQGGGGSGDMTYMGEFSNIAYAVGNVVRVSPTNTIATTSGGGTVPGVYVCIAARPVSGNNPAHPLSGGENSTWNWLATWPSISVTCDESGTITSSIVDSQANPSTS